MNVSGNLVRVRELSFLLPCRAGHLLRHPPTRCEDNSDSRWQQRNERRVNGFPLVQDAVVLAFRLRDASGRVDAKKYAVFRSGHQLTLYWEWV
jgi:hypothetical protein